MKAVFLEKPGGLLVVNEVDIPQPGRGEVLIRISAAPVNPSDIMKIKNAHKEHDLNMYIPGLEGSGTVVAAGKGLLPAIWKGRRVACLSKYPASGTWAEYMVTSAGNCFPLNRNVPDEQGAMSFVNPLTALGFIDIVREGKHKAFINNAAASALGSMVELLSKKHRIPLINIVRSQNQVDLLKSQGSEYVLNSIDPLFAETLNSLASELRATILFDSVCGPQLHIIVEALPFGSSVVIYGNLSPEEYFEINPRKLLSNDIHVSGFYLGNRTRKNGMLKNTLNLMKVGRLMSRDLTIKIQRRFPLERAQEAVDTYVKNMTAGKVILQPCQPVLINSRIISR